MSISDSFVIDRMLPCLLKRVSQPRFADPNHSLAIAHLGFLCSFFVFNISSYHIDEVSSFHSLIVLIRLIDEQMQFIYYSSIPPSTKYRLQLAVSSRRCLALIHVEFEFEFDFQDAGKLERFRLFHDADTQNRILDDDNKELFRRSRCITEFLQLLEPEAWPCAVVPT
jgi:hypothetical protein